MGWRLVLGAMMALLVAATSGASVWAQPVPTAGDWEPTGLREPALRLFAPSSGALLAAGGGKLFRSEDAGTTWREVALPPDAVPLFGVGSAYNPPPVGQGRVAVHPNNPDVVYVAAAGGLRKSGDGGATWSALPVFGDVAAVAVSPADPSFVHVVLGVTTEGTPGVDWQRLRSRDGGATWELLDELMTRPLPGRAPVGHAVYLLQPHPTLPERLFIAAGDASGRGLGIRIADQYDGPDPRPGPRLELNPGGTFLDAEHLVGGAGAAPGRYYAASSQRLSSYNHGTTTNVLRVDEGGAPATLLTVTGGGVLDGKKDGDLLKPAVFVDALAYDPAAPDLVYVGLNEYQATVKASGSSLSSVEHTRARSHVLASDDAGSTWRELGQADLGAEIHDLALGVDGATIYTATEAGVLRLRLGSAGATPEGSSAGQAVGVLRKLPRSP